MKYSHQRELVEGLRAMADFIEENIELPFDDGVEIRLNEWLYDDSTYYGQNPRTAREKLAEVARIFGKSEKVHAGTYFDLVKKFSPRVRLEYTVNRESVCKRVVKEVIEHPEEIVPRHVKPARREEVVEWVCDEPILAG